MFGNVSSRRWWVVGLLLVGIWGCGDDSTGGSAVEDGGLDAGDAVTSDSYSPIVLTDITMEGGTCEVLDGPCKASSTHKALVQGGQGTVSYEWIVTGADLESGQGTDTITVSTTSDSTVAFTVACTVSDGISTDSMSKEFAHGRSGHHDPVYVPTYYVDATNGDDSNDGLSEQTAWKTLARVAAGTYRAGDVIALKRGEIWNESLALSGLEGTESAPVVITAYGSGPRPVIDINVYDYAFSWEDMGGGKWRAAYGRSMIFRLWRDGTERKRTVSTLRLPDRAQEEFDSRIAGIEWMWKDDYLWLWSDDDPSGSRFVLAVAGTSAFVLRTSRYVKISGLDIRGGNESIRTYDCSYITFEYNTIGVDSGYGMVPKGAANDHFLIERNTFDDNFFLNFDGIESFRGTDGRGSNDGFVTWTSFTDSEIRYNSFLNWGHAGFAMTDMGGNDVSNNKIHHNYFYADIHYSRGIAYSGDGVNNNEIFYNLIENMWTRGQLNGQDNHIHHNLWRDQFRSPYKTGALGQAIVLEPYNGKTTGNVYEYNTFQNIADAGFEIIGYNTAPPVIEGNTIRKNLFDTCGVDPYRSSDQGVALIVTDWNDVGGNTFEDNAFVNGADAPIRHRDVFCTPEEFNDRDGVGGDSISGNTDVVTDQGAGVMPPVGVDAPVSR